MSPVVRLGLLTLAAVGGSMLWLQRDQPVDGVTILICAVGGSIGAGFAARGTPRIWEILPLSQGSKRQRFSR